MLRLKSCDGLSGACRQPILHASTIERRMKEPRHERVARPVRIDEKAPTVVAFVERALEFFAAHAITARRLQTDNAWSYTRNRDLRDLLLERGIRHRTIPPRMPKRNGKVERYQQTLAREWAYGQRYRDSTPARQRCRSGSSITTPPATTARSPTGRPSAAFGTSRGTTASGLRRARRPSDVDLRRAAARPTVRSYVPVQVWRRFSRNAATPWRKSSLP